MLVKRQLGFLSFSLIYSVFTLIVYQAPLYSFAIAATNPWKLSGLTNIVVLTALQPLLMIALFGLLSLLGHRFLKAVAALLLIINSVALYFMLTYNIEIDRTMIGNVINTDNDEVGGLVHPSIAAWVVPLGILPALWVIVTPLSLPRYIWRPLIPVGALIGIMAVALTFSITWPWFDANAKQIGARVLPWAYIANSARYFEKRARENLEVVALPNAFFARDLPKGRRQIVVLVIGESARGQNFSAYGYHRDTNAKTRSAGYVAMPASEACATYTTAAVACILSYRGRAAGEFSSDEPLPTFLQRMGIVTTVRLNNTGTPPLDVYRLQRAVELESVCNEPLCAEGIGDSMLFAGLPELFADTSHPRQFVLLHLTGSHGPAYYKKYPEKFANFTPVCNTVQVQDCSRDSLVNAYDNTLVYTDYLLAELAKMLAENGDTVEAAVLYVSDHGESLGESGLYLHGAPMAFAPPEQTTVPFLVWTSAALTQVVSNLNVDNNVAAQDAVFHSVLGAFGLAGGPYDPSKDIFNSEADTR
jgi:lipid A ethanolaminephosphotransferase